MHWIIIGTAIVTALVLFMRFRGRKKIKNQDIAY